MIVGQNRAVAQFAEGWSKGSLHHAWLLAGPCGVGKATFAHAAARRVLAQAAGPPFDLPGVDTPEDHPIVRLIEAGSHPDMRVLRRLRDEKTDKVARSITVKQVRSLGDFMGLTAALSAWRVVVVDSVDDLETSGANALLKMLEEPPPNTLFFLVSHAPGRLLPTIRSRCRRLQFDLLDDDAMTSVLEKELPDLTAPERQRALAAAFGSAGRAVAVAELGLAKLQDAAVAIMKTGDATNAKRSELAQELGKKGAAERYAAFLELAPSLIAAEARGLNGDRLARALDAYAKTRELAVVAPRVSLDPAATVFQIGGFLAEVAARPS